MAVVITPLIDDTPDVIALPVEAAELTSAYRVVFSLPVSNLQPEDVVFIKSQFEVTSQGPRFEATTTLYRFIVRGASPTDTTGVRVAQAIGTDFLTDQFSEGVVLLGVDTGMPSGNYYYNVVAYAISAAGPGAELMIPTGYGDCAAIVMDCPPAVTP